MSFGRGDVSVKVGADVYDLERGMIRSKKAVGGFNADVKKISVNLAKFGATAALAIGGVAVAAVGLASKAASAAKEIQNLSNLAGVGAEQFQRYAAGAKTVGVEQDKLADIFKDVNDKFGDFLETGAGPLADFFENIAPKVGVTAGQFARLSGPEALQLYVDSLEKAGVSQQRMTFYMEALASDATGLLPLLKNNGEAMRSLGEEASRSGRILSQDAVDAGSKLDDEFRELSETLRTSLNSAILENSDEIVDLVKTITEDWIPALVSVAAFVADVVAAIANLVGEISRAIVKVADFGATVADAIGFDGQTAGSGSRRRSGKRKTNDDQRNPINPDLFDPRNGVYGDFSSDFEPNEASGGLALTGDALQAQEEARFEALERLREYRESQEQIEADADEIRKANAQQTADELVEIERRAQAAKMSAVQSAFGDLSSLMTTESNKLFKIGKAASLAEAVVSGYSAATAAWDKGMKAGGPPLAAAFTAASLARTGALISSISSQTIGGGSGGSSGGGNSAANAQAAPVDRQVAEFRFSGEFFRPEAIIDAINEAQDRGYVIKAVLS